MEAVRIEKVANVDTELRDRSEITRKVSKTSKAQLEPPVGSECGYPTAGIPE